MQSPKNAAAGFGTRWIAYIIDCLLSGLLSGVIGLPIMIVSLFSEESIWTTRVLFDFTLYAVVMYCIRALYFVILTYAFGKTPGKMLLRIEVQSKDGEKLTFVNVLFRETIGRFLSGFIMNVGYLIALSGKEHLALHDMLCDTRVCYTDLTEMKKKTPVNVQVAQPIPHVVANAGAVVGGETIVDAKSASGDQTYAAVETVSGEQTNVNAETVAAEQTNVNAQTTAKAPHVYVMPEKGESQNNSTQQVWTLPNQQEATVSAEQEKVKEPVQLEEVVIPEQEETPASENKDEEQV